MKDKENFGEKCSACGKDVKTLTICYLSQNKFFAIFLSILLIFESDDCKAARTMYYSPQENEGISIPTSIHSALPLEFIVFHCFTHKKCSLDIFYFAQSFNRKPFGKPIVRLFKIEKILNYQTFALYYNRFYDTL